MKKYELLIWDKVLICVENCKLGIVYVSFSRCIVYVYIGNTYIFHIMRRIYKVKRY